MSSTRCWPVVRLIRNSLPVQPYMSLSFRRSLTLEFRIPPQAPSSTQPCRDNQAVHPTEATGPIPSDVYSHPEHPPRLPLLDPESPPLPRTQRVSALGMEARYTTTSNRNSDTAHRRMGETIRCAPHSGRQGSDSDCP